VTSVFTGTSESQLHLLTVVLILLHLRQLLVHILFQTEDVLTLFGLFTLA